MIDKKTAWKIFGTVLTILGTWIWVMPLREWLIKVAPIQNQVILGFAVSGMGAWLVQKNGKG